MKKTILSISLGVIGLCQSGAQPSFKEYEALFTTPRHYVACYTPIPLVVDGKLNEEAWQKAIWSDPFLDIEGTSKPEPRLRTRMKMTWDSNYLYVAAELEEPHVWAYVEKRDEVVFHDNDFEVFISPVNNTHAYFEIEVNARNTIFDLFMPKPYRNGSGALISWDTPGLQSAIQINGTLNHPSDQDQSWIVEMAIPFRAVTIGNSADIPEEGNLWRINFSRVEWHTDLTSDGYTRQKDSSGKLLPEDNWVWSPQGVINMHYPERWGYLLFTQETLPEKAPTFELPYAEKQKQYLWLIYYKQQAYREKKGRYASTFAELGIQTSEFEIDGKLNTMNMEATTEQFQVKIQQKGSHQTFSLNQEGLVETTRQK